MEVMHGDVFALALAVRGCIQADEPNARGPEGSILDATVREEHERQAHEQPSARARGSAMCQGRDEPGWRWGDQLTLWR